MSDIDKLRTVAALGRLATLSAAYQLDVRAFIERLGELGPELGERAWVGVPATFDRLAISTWVPPVAEARARARALVAAADAAQPERFAALGGEQARKLRIELETVPGRPAAMSVALLAPGTRDLTSDLERLRASGASADALSELRHATRLLGAEDRLAAIEDRSAPDAPPVVTLFIAHPNDDEDARRDTRLRLRETANLLGVTRPQRDLVDSVHDMLARGQTSMAGLRLVGDRMAPALVVIWNDVPWEHVVRMMMGFHPAGDCPRKLGELAGAAGKDETATAVELTLGPTEPPGMKVTARLQGELS